MSPPRSLAVSNLELAYGPRLVIEQLTLTVPPGRVTAVLGPNGSGKSTLLHALARVLPPRQGAVLLDGTDLRDHPTRAVARVLALLPQAPQTPEDVTVRDLAMFGRFPYRGWFGATDADDHTAVERALATVGITHMATRPVHTLSGGERQRAWLAMALAQGTDYLLLDEPTTFLDVAHQLEVMAIVRRLNHDLGKTVVLTIHDLNLAARFADHLILLRDGRVHAAGPPTDALTLPTLREVFRVDGTIHHDPATHAPVFLPHTSLDDPQEPPP